jgi:hypothetical protein
MKILRNALRIQHMTYFLLFHNRVVRAFQLEPAENGLYEIDRDIPNAEIFQVGYFGI